MLSFIFKLSTVNADCVDYRPNQYFDWNTYADKTIPIGPEHEHVKMGSEMTVCELAELVDYCVEKMNYYRTERPAFTCTPGVGDCTTTTPDFLPVGPLVHHTDAQTCTSERTATQVVWHESNGSTGCTDAHKFFGDCYDFTGIRSNAENSCCLYTEGTNDFESAKKRLTQCLESMYNEGAIAGDDYQKKGHYWNMTANFKSTTCSFAWDSQGKLLSIQQFYTSLPTGTTATPYTLPPVTQTDAPITYTQAPVTQTDAPITYTQAPVTQTDAPSGPTYDPNGPKLCHPTDQLIKEAQAGQHSERSSWCKYAPDCSMMADYGCEMRPVAGKCTPKSGETMACDFWSDQPIACMHQQSQFCEWSYLDGYQA